MPEAEPSQYLGYYLDAQQVGLEWQVRATAGPTVERIPAVLSVAKGRTRPEAFREAMALVDEFVMRPR
jgi:hypothetical protein